MARFHLVSDDSVWMFKPDIVLSTIQLPEFDSMGYESCLFCLTGDSRVVDRYDTKEQAINGHVKLENEYFLKRKKNVLR